MNTHIVENGISYTLGEDERYYPDFAVPDDRAYHIGKYGRLRFRYLKEHKKVTFTNLLTTGKLRPHLEEVDRNARTLFFSLVEDFSAKEGLSEQRKRDDQMKWVGMMNHIRACAEEIVMAELIYV